MNVAFDSGDFTVLHPGHLRLLRFASERAERLVVGVRSRALAGRQDLFDDDVRLQAVRHVDIVDEVLLIDEDIATVIGRLRPDFVVKGREHRDGVNAEEAVLSTYGGRLVFAPGDSTMDILDLGSDTRSRPALDLGGEANDFVRRRAIDIKRLKDIIQRFTAVNVWVVGDLIVDDYIECEPLGMSREDASIAVIPVGTKRYTGGAGVVAAHVAGLGAAARFCTVVGSDAAGESARTDLVERGVRATLVIDPDRPTTVKERYRANGATLLRVNRLSRLSVSDRIQQQFRADFEDWKSGVDGERSAVLFADFNYGCLPQSLVDVITHAAREAGLVLAADSQTSSQLGDIGRFVDMDLITPTEHEARVAMRSMEDGLVVLADALQQRTRARNVVMTLGDQGALLHIARDTQDYETDRIPAIAARPVDPAGAGDGLLATATVALGAGANIWEAVYLGSLAAAIQVSRNGNVPVQRDDLLALLD